MNEILNTINMPSFHAAGLMAFVLVALRVYQTQVYNTYNNHIATKIGYIGLLMVLGAYLTYVWIAPDPVYYQYGIMLPQTETLSGMVTVSAVAALILSYIGGRVYHDFSLR
jgi:hypothetical protein|nr:MAG TPA: hypothetical protein [Caudoviricetes sp.]